MKIKIRDINQTPVWGIPEAGIHLSCEHNEPIEIDHTKLTDIQQTIIWNGLMTKSLEIDDTTGFVPYFKDKFFSEPKEEVKVEKVNEEKPPKTKQAKDSSAQVSSFLNRGIASLKKDLPNLTCGQLKVLSVLEKKNKNRKTVVSLIDKLIEVKGVERSMDPLAEGDSCLENQSFVQAKDGLEKKYLKNIGDIVESEEYEIEIT